MKYAKTGQKALESLGGVCYTDFAKRRRSILVRSAASEEGPKNPLKGIAVKPLVPAANAQFGVGAGREARTPRACGFRAFPNGMGKPTLLSWRPVFVHGRTPFCGNFDLCTTQGRNLQCGATRPLSRERCVQM